MNVDRELLLETEPHRFVAEASDLGILAATPIPNRLDVPGLGNGMPFLISHSDGSSWTYRQANGCVSIRLFND